MTDDLTDLIARLEVYRCHKPGREATVTALPTARRSSGGAISGRG